MKGLGRWSLLVIGMACSGLGLGRAIADEFPPCAPPAANEYLLLVQGRSAEVRDRIQNLLPTTTNVTICRYLDDVVVRAGGFTSLENANAWAQYLTEVEEAQAFVARPAAPGEVVNTTPNAPISSETVVPVPEVETPLPASTRPPTATPSTPSSSTPPTTPSLSTPSPGAQAANQPQAVVAYDPKLLGEGYAILVDYGNDPAVAKRLQQSLNQPVGLAVYERRPFLLVAHSTNAQTAAQVLQTLSNNRFGAFIVNSREVVVLSSGVATP